MCLVPHFWPKDLSRMQIQRSPAWLTGPSVPAPGPGAMALPGPLVFPGWAHHPWPAGHSLRPLLPQVRIQTERKHTGIWHCIRDTYRQERVGLWPGWARGRGALGTGPSLPPACESAFGPWHSHLPNGSSCPCLSEACAGASGAPRGRGQERGCLLSFTFVLHWLFERRSYTDKVKERDAGPSAVA